MFRRDRKKSERRENGFVNAMGWDELLRSYKRQPSQVRGERSLTAAMQAENPEFNDIPLRRNRRASWNLSMLPEAERDDRFNEVEPLMSIQDVDSCFCDSDFVMESSITQQRFEIKVEAPDLDLELGLLEAVQDVSRAIARVQVRRSADAPPIENESVAGSAAAD